MILGFNISLFIGIIMIPLFYAFIVYLTSPHKSIEFKTGLQYMLAGFASVTLIPFIITLIPGWKSGSSPLQETFFFIATREELVKLSLFLLIDKMRSGMGKKDHPIGTMFYMCMVGLGFAIYENIQYIHMYGQQVLGVRLITATIAHMLFGMFMGYWIALGRINTGKYGNRSVFGILMNKNPKLKQYIYIFIGWLSAVCYHGLWNYNLVVSSNAYCIMDFKGNFNTVTDVSNVTIMIMLIFFGLVGAKFATKDLNDNYRRKFRK